MIKQNTDWGQILWLAENREILPFQGLQVGIVSLFPGRNQARHIHYDEQVIYVVRGQARSIRDRRHGRERKRCLESDTERKAGSGIYGYPYALYEWI